MYWNVSGVGNSDTKVALKNLYVSHKHVFIFLVEPMISFSLVPSWYWHVIGASKSCLNDRGHISDQCIAIEVHQNFSRIFMRTGVVYLSLDFRRRL